MLINEPASPDSLNFEIKHYSEKEENMEDFIKDDPNKISCVPGLR
jgi:hypothetical protein